MMIIKFPVFKDKRGNRFIFPNLYSGEGKSVSWTFCRQTCVALGVSEEKETFNQEVDGDGMLNFPRVVAEAGSAGFAHGSSVVWLIGGPEFEKHSALGEYNEHS
jgi:hypothetical protein